MYCQKWLIAHDFEENELESELPANHESVVNPWFFIPSDFAISGPVTELEFWEKLVRPIEYFVEITCLFDCQVSESAFALSYSIGAPALHREKSLLVKSDQKDEFDLITSLSEMLIFAKELTSLKANLMLPHDYPQHQSRATFQLITVVSNDMTTSAAKPGETTSAFVDVLTNLKSQRLTIESLLFHMREQLDPPLKVLQLSSNRPIDFHEQFTMTSGRGIDRALLISVNFSATPSVKAPSDDVREAAHRDLTRFKTFLVEIYGFSDSNCWALTYDDTAAKSAMRETILATLERLARMSKTNDSIILYCFFNDISRDRKEDIDPDATQLFGAITGEDVWNHFVAIMAEGVRITALFDSPTNVMTLPYSFEANDEQAKVFIPATVHVVGGNQGDITIPFLTAMSRSVTDGWLPTIDKMKDIMLDISYPDREPILSSSRRLRRESEMEITAQGGGGTKKALLVSISYIGLKGLELEDAKNNLENVKQYLRTHHGFTSKQWIVLEDTSISNPPSRRNMMRGIKHLVDNAKPSDSLIFYYFGHGNAVLRKEYGLCSRIDDRHVWEEALVPSDIDTYGRNAILDHELLNCLVRPLPEGCTLTCIVDCYQSRSPITLPYFYHPPPTRGGSLRRSENSSSRLSVGTETSDADSGNGIVRLLSGAWSKLKDETHQNQASSSSIESVFRSNG
jgi:hypothetical protein